jgi:hypothetical protein
MKKIKLLTIAAALFFLSCGEGITPEPDSGVAGFSGTITFIGEWADSIKRTHLLVFERELLAPSDFNPLNLKYVSTEIPFGTRIYGYNSAIDSSFLPIEPGYYQYVAVVQSASEELTFNRFDWWVAGLYYENGDSSRVGHIVIPADQTLRNINIVCDLNNLPPQPPGGINND